MKANIHLGLDTDVIELAKAKKVNVSEVVNNYLKQYLLVDDKNIPNEKDLLIEERAKKQAEVDIIESRLRKIAETEANKRQEALKRQQEYEEKIKSGEIVEWKG